MTALIIKLGATGDVVRTTTLLRKLDGAITWITAAKNAVLLRGLERDVRCVSWEARDSVAGTEYDLVINLEDDRETGAFLQKLRFKQLFGAYLDSEGSLRYTEDSRGWFDLSIISRFGLEQANQLKFHNRKTYQELIFGGLGWEFSGEGYVLPRPAETDLRGDVAMAPVARPVWPMKNWAYYEDLKIELEKSGYTINVLPERASLLEHLADVRNHRCLVSGDSLPMHFALGTGTRCVSIFNCTSPWEIYDYGVQRKIVSPLIENYWYQHGFDKQATTAVSLEEVVAGVVEELGARR